MSVKTERPVITPEPFSGERSWEDWIDQFESIASINGWNDEQKLIWWKGTPNGKGIVGIQEVFSDSSCVVQECSCSVS